MLDRLKTIAAILGMIVGFIIVFSLVHSCMVKLSCANEQPGTMIVIGGNSVRCP